MSTWTVIWENADRALGRFIQLHQKGARYRGISPIRNSTPLGPYSRTMPRALWWPYEGGAVSYERGTPVSVSPRPGSDMSAKPPLLKPDLYRCLAKGARQLALCRVRGGADRVLRRPHAIDAIETPLLHDANVPDACTPRVPGLGTVCLDASSSAPASTPPPNPRLFLLLLL